MSLGSWRFAYVQHGINPSRGGLIPIGDNRSQLEPGFLCRCGFTNSSLRRMPAVFKRIFQRIFHGAASACQSFWTALAERSGDSAFGRAKNFPTSGRPACVSRAAWRFASRRTPNFFSAPEALGVGCWMFSQIRSVAGGDAAARPSARRKLFCNWVTLL